MNVHCYTDDEIDQIDLGQPPKINIPTVHPELVEGLPVLRQAQHERQMTGVNYFLGAALSI
jgi:hypothetical protein